MRAVPLAVRGRPLLLRRREEEAECAPLLCGQAVCLGPERRSCFQNGSARTEARAMSWGTELWVSLKSREHFSVKVFLLVVAALTL